MFPASTKSGGVHVTAGPLDACKTPSPGGPIPIPYGNMVDGLAQSGDKAGRRTRKKIIKHAQKKNFWVTSATAAAIASQSTGDEAGVAKGIASSTVMPQSRMLSVSSQGMTNAPGRTLTPSQTKLIIMGDPDSDSVSE